MKAERENLDKTGRTELIGWSVNDTLEEQANYLINYYQNLWNGQNEAWLLGLYMSKQWLLYIREPQHDLQELKLFVQVLESQRQNQGSGWSDLWCRVRIWVEQIENHNQS